MSLTDRAISSLAAGRPDDTPVLALAEVVGASLDLTATLQATAAALRSATGADRTMIYVHDPERHTLRQVITTVDQLDWDELVSLRGREVGNVPLWLAVRNSGDGVLELPDTVSLEALEPDMAARSGMRALLGLALRHPSVSSGSGMTQLAIAFCTWDEPQQAFPPEMVRLARSLAAQAAVAIANAHNHALGERLVDRLSRLAISAGRIAAADTPAQVAARTARAAAALLEAPIAAHWSPGRVTWYPAPPAREDDCEAALALLGAERRRWSVIGARDAPPALAAALAGRGLSRLLVAGSSDGGGLVVAARNAPAGPVEEKVACLLADLAGSALRTAKAHVEVARQAVTDGLTGVGNRRAFDARLAEALALANRTSRPLALCLVDVDNFRDFNETGGHQRGDEALRFVADTLRAEIRASDLAFRVGGDEFALILPDTEAANAVSLVQRVMEGLRVGTVGPITVTAGVAQAPRHGTDPTTLSRSADRALYRGKRAGRARVVLAELG